ncbi:MAG: hypothetical protein ACPGWR_16915 [Ardenticatenaceae bacterium]
MDHRHTLQFFLQTDHYRLEAALDEYPWTPEVAERLTDHLRFAAQLQAVFLEGVHPHDTGLQAALEAVSPQSMDDALEQLYTRTEGLIKAIEQATDARLNAPVLDRHERGFCVLGHLYEFSRANAMLVEWARNLSLQTMENEGVLRDLVGEDAWMSDQ